MMLMLMLVLVLVIMMMTLREEVSSSPPSLTFLGWDNDDKYKNIKNKKGI